MCSIITSVYMKIVIISIVLLKKYSFYLWKGCDVRQLISCDIPDFTQTPLLNVTQHYLFCVSVFAKVVSRPSWRCSRGHTHVISCSKWRRHGKHDALTWHRFGTKGEIRCSRRNHYIVRDVSREIVFDVVVSLRTRPHKQKCPISLRCLRNEDPAKVYKYGFTLLLTNINTLAAVWSSIYNGLWAVTFGWKAIHIWTMCTGSHIRM